MSEKSQLDYSDLLTSLVQRYIVVFGPDVVFAKLSHISGVDYNEHGKILKIDGDPKSMLEKVVSDFYNFSPLVVKKVGELLLKEVTSATASELTTHMNTHIISQKALEELNDYILTLKK